MELHPDIQRSIAEGGAKLLARGVQMNMGEMFYDNGDDAISCLSFTPPRGAAVKEVVIRDNHPEDRFFRKRRGPKFGRASHMFGRYYQTRALSRYERPDLFVAGGKVHVFESKSVVPEDVQVIAVAQIPYGVAVLTAQRTINFYNGNLMREVVPLNQHLPVDAEVLCMRVVGEHIFLLYAHAKYAPIGARDDAPIGARDDAPVGARDYGLTFWSGQEGDLVQTKTWTDARLPTVFVHGHHVLVMSSEFRHVYTAGMPYRRNLSDFAKNYAEIFSFNSSIFVSAVAVGVKGFRLVAAYETGVRGLVDLVLHPNPLQSHVYRDALRLRTLEPVSSFPDTRLLGCTATPSLACVMLAVRNTDGHVIVFVDDANEEQELDIKQRSLHPIRGLNEFVEGSLQVAIAAGKVYFCDRESDIREYVMGNTTEALVASVVLDGEHVNVEVTAVASLMSTLHVAFSFDGVGYIQTQNMEEDTENTGELHSYAFDSPGLVEQILPTWDEDEIFVVYRDAQGVKRLGVVEIDRDRVELGKPITRANFGAICTLQEGSLYETDSGRRYSIRPHEWGDPAGRNIFERMPIAGVCTFDGGRCLVAIRDGDSVDLCLCKDPAKLDESEAYWGVFSLAWKPGYDNELAYLRAPAEAEGGKVARLLNILNGLNLDTLTHLTTVFSSHAQREGGFIPGSRYTPPAFGGVLGQSKLDSGQRHSLLREKFLERLKQQQ